MFEKLAVLLLMTLVSQATYSGLPDPTRPAYADTPQAPAIIDPDLEPKLSAIWFLPKSRWATINGIQVREGQLIGGTIKIVKIRKNTVTIDQNGTIKTLQLIKRPLMFQ
ncbi:hypothetical protein MCAMS1_02022 [biofilm metagenome]